MHLLDLELTNSSCITFLWGMEVSFELEFIGKIFRAFVGPEIKVYDRTSIRFYLA